MQTLAAVRNRLLERNSISIFAASILSTGISNAGLKNRPGKKNYIDIINYISDNDL